MPNYERDSWELDSFRALQGDYVLHNQFTKQAIAEIMKKFKEIGSFTNLVRSEHYHNAGTAKNIISFWEINVDKLNFINFMTLSAFDI